MNSVEPIYFQITTILGIVGWASAMYCAGRVRKLSEGMKVLISIHAEAERDLVAKCSYALWLEKHLAARMENNSRTQNIETIRSNYDRYCGEKSNG